jgi:phosphoglycerate dehydrogenase-like enzyme
MSPEAEDQRRSGRPDDDPVVVCLPDGPDREHIGPLPPNVEVRLVPPEPAPIPDLADVELVVPSPRIRRPLLELLAGPPGSLRVIQTTTAGVDWLAGHVPAHVRVCNARGVYDAPLAEWVVGAILAMQRGLVSSRDAQARHDWASIEPPELLGRRVVILGLGSIGSAIAARLAPFGVDIVGVGRLPRAGVRGLADLEDVLVGADIVVNMLPLTRRTRGLIDARRLALLPDRALLVNAGRGPTVDTGALVTELRSGRLRAALDVTDPEPLPPDHPLWSLPSCLITPHMAGDSPDSPIRAFALAGDQIRRYAAGQPLFNEVERYLLE